MRVPVPTPIPAAETLGRVHFVGIGGAGLSAIARVMLGRGIAVSGSDGTDSPTLAALRDLGATVFLGHAAHQVDHLTPLDTLVVSTAVREDNPEVVEAYARGLRVLPRSAGLASLMLGHRALCVAGTHGKTTTTSLLTVALQAAGADPTYAIGADLAATGVNAGVGSGDLFVAEADESDGAFLVYEPFAGVIVNVEADHLDVWGDAESYAAAFGEFADHVSPDGFLVVCTDHPGAAAVYVTQRLLGGPGRLVSVGLEPAPDAAAAGAHLRAFDLRSHDGAQRFAVERGGERLGEVSLRIPGRHYVVDALAALAVGLELGYPFEALAAGLASFTGARRRMESRGEPADTAGVRVYDSYAHHPTEIAGDLEAARQLAGPGRVIVAFQPHLVSRTRIFGAEMGHALGAADLVVLTDVYLAREDPDPEVTGASVAAAVPLPGAAVTYVPDLDDVAPVLAGLARPGDLVLTLGAGTITRVAGEVVALLAARNAGGGRG